jgi:hypothetical protein
MSSKLSQHWGQPWPKSMKCDQAKTSFTSVSYGRGDDWDEGSLWTRSPAKVKKNQVPVGSQIIGSRFQNKIKRHHGGHYRLRVKRLKVRLVVQGHDMCHLMTTSCKKVESTCYTTDISFATNCYTTDISASPCNNRSAFPTPLLRQREPGRVRTTRVWEDDVYSEIINTLNKYYSTFPEY